MESILLCSSPHRGIRTDPVQKKTNFPVISSIKMYESCLSFGKGKEGKENQGSSLKWANPPHKSHTACCRGAVVGLFYSKWDIWCILLHLTLSKPLIWFGNCRKTYFNRLKGRKLQPCATDWLISLNPETQACVNILCRIAIQKRCYSEAEAPSPLRLSYSFSSAGPLRLGRHP